MQPRFSPDGTAHRDRVRSRWPDEPVDDGHRAAATCARSRANASARSRIRPGRPDGQYIVGRKHFRNTRSVGAGEMWLYHIGGGNGLKLTDRRNWEQNATEPTLSPDGRYVYFSEDVSPGGGFQYNRDPYTGVYVVQRLDRQTGQRRTWISGAGGSIGRRSRPMARPSRSSAASTARAC